MINQLQSFLPKHWVVSVVIVMGMLRFLTHHWLVVWNQPRAQNLPAPVRLRKPIWVVW